MIRMGGIVGNQFKSFYSWISSKGNCLFVQHCCRRKSKLNQIFSFKLFSLSVRSRTLLMYNEESEQPPSTLNISDYLRAFSVVFSFSDDKPEVESYAQPPSISFDENRSMNDEPFTSREYSFSK